MLCLAGVLVLSASSPPPAIPAPATIENIPPPPHSAPSGTSPTELVAAIKLAANELDRDTIDESDDAVKLLRRIQSHRAEVIVGFDDTNCWINCSDSVDLDYNQKDFKIPERKGPGPPSWKVIDGPQIHHSYNVWVSKLSKRIALRMKAPPPPGGEKDGQTDRPLLIADELEKLDSLRQRGILTQDEFDQQKAKLLAR
jgi:hypothetical protein